VFSLSFSLAAESQGQSSANKKPGAEPIFILDSVRINRNALDQIQANDISTISVYKDEHAIKLFGADGANGVVCIETKKFARTKYWRFLKSKSAEYRQAVPSPEADSNVVYILNGSVLAKDAESTLSSITDETFLDLKVIDKQTLSKQYGLANRSIGVMINIKKKPSQ